MAESTLTLAWTDLIALVGYYLSYGGSSTNWSTDKTDKIDEIIQTGIRQFYYPPPPFAGHRWRFLHPVTTITAWATATGTMTVTGTGNTTITDSTKSPFYPSMVGKSIVATNASYVISAYTSSSVVTVSTDASADDGEAFTITADGDCRLPDNYGGIDGDLNFGAGEMYWTVPVVGEGRIRTMRQQQGTGTSRPRFAAVQPVASDGTAGQRFNLMVWPTPGSDYTLHYRYNVLVDKLSSSAAYHLGGMAHSETVKASCIAAAEQDVNDAKGVKWDAFMARLASSVETDNKANTPEYLGYNADRSDGAGAPARREWSDHIVTYNGVAYP